MVFQYDVSIVSSPATGTDDQYVNIDMFKKTDKVLLMWLLWINR